MFNIRRLVAIGFAFLGSVGFCAVMIWVLAELLEYLGLAGAMVGAGVLGAEALVAYALIVAYVLAIGWAFWRFYRKGQFQVLILFLALVGSMQLASSVLGLAMYGLAQVGRGAGLPLLIAIVLFYTWTLYAYFQYRQSRQDEFLNFLSAVVSARAPLAPALDAYLRDRPQGPLREAFVIGLLLVLPGYYWIWHQWHSYDRKLGRVADLLDQGYSLSEALAAVPGVASRETVMLASLGQVTARLDVCLRGSLQQRYAAVWLEVLPRLAYPVALVYFLSAVGGFWMIFIFPKLQRIFLEFNQELPWQTALLGEVGSTLADYPWLVPVCVLAFLAVVSVLIGNPTARWYCPGISRLYRGHVQAQVLRLLGLLLAAGKTVPESLHILAEADYFAPVAQRRLREAARRVEQGEPLAASLSAGRLVPGTLAPLVQAAEHLRNLPWALAEIGEHLANRTIRLIRRMSLLISPATVFAVGIIIGFGVVAMFIPILQLMESLHE